METDEKTMGIVNLDGTGFNTGECYCPKAPKKEIENGIHSYCGGTIPHTE